MHLGTTCNILNSFSNTILPHYVYKRAYRIVEPANQPQADLPKDTEHLAKVFFIC